MPSTYKAMDTVLAFECHSAEAQGLRSQMDDRVIVGEKLNLSFGKNSGCLLINAIFGGFGGAGMSEWLHKNFVSTLADLLDKISKKELLSLEFIENWDEEMDQSRENPKIIYDLQNFYVVQETGNFEQKLEIFRSLMDVLLKKTFNILRETYPKSIRAGSTAVVSVIYDYLGSKGIFCAYTGDSECYLICKDSYHNFTRNLHKPDPRLKDYKRATTLEFDFSFELCDGIYRMGGISLCRGFYWLFDYGWQPTVGHVPMPEDFVALYLACDGVRDRDGKITNEDTILDLSPDVIVKTIRGYLNNRKVSSSGMPGKIVNFALNETKSGDNVSVVWVSKL